MWTVDAPAKVNLQLSVIGRRSDGYHCIDSLVVFAGLADKISLTPAEYSSLAIGGSGGTTGGGGTTGSWGDRAEHNLENNIIGLALNAFRRATGLECHYAIGLEKNIPVAGGLGGGSADAAAVLHLLNQIHGFPLDDDGLDRLALGIGADVVVCLHAKHGGCWRIEGVGETVEKYPLDIPIGDYGLVLLNNGEGVSTKAVFLHCADTGIGKKPLPRVDSPQVGFLDRLAWGNDLLASALALYPSLAKTAELIKPLAQEDGFIHAGMSGSGGSFFALFTTPNHAKNAMNALPPQGYWGWAGGIFTP